MEKFMDENEVMKEVEGKKKTFVVGIILLATPEAIHELKHILRDYEEVKFVTMRIRKGMLWLTSKKPERIFEED